MTAAGEAERLNALRQLNILDTPPSESFDRITRMASQIFDLPIAAVSLTETDRQWFKSRVGVDHWSIPREKAPCAQVADSSAMLVIPDMLSDEVYRDSLLAKNGIRFYAGAPLVTAQGHSLGAMCVLGTQARDTTDKELAALNDLAAMVMAQIELQHAFGRIDPVSGLPNRTQLIEDLLDLARDGEAGTQRHLVLVDLIESDRVSEAARVVGPSYVDDLVRTAAHTITSTLGPARKAYHVSATQMAFMALPGIKPCTYRKALEDGVHILESVMGSRYIATPAIGVAPFILGSVEPAAVLRMAHSASQDARQLEAKVGFYSQEMDEDHKRRHALIHDFGLALQASDQLRLVYQPRMDIASNTCVGVVALLRWRHPLLGEIFPSEFIPIVERTTLAKPATAWVLDAALAQAAAWRSAGLDLQVSVNVSAANLEETDFLERLQAALALHGVPASGLELEVTESAMMGDSNRAMALLASVSEAGVSLAIDDFGTGYSSLAYLQRLPATTVKIDRSFMGGITQDDRDLALVRTMIALCHEFKYRVVAEGIETIEALALLAQAGCDEGQGYFYAKPMAPDDLTAWLVEAAASPLRSLLGDVRRSTKNSAGKEKAV